MDPGPPVASPAANDPLKLKRLAPEIVTHNYLLAYPWRGNDPRGIFRAPLVWDD